MIIYFVMELGVIAATMCFAMFLKTSGISGTESQTLTLLFLGIFTALIVCLAIWDLPKKSKEE